MSSHPVTFSNEGEITDSRYVPLDDYQFEQLASAIEHHDALCSTQIKFPRVIRDVFFPAFVSPIQQKMNEADGVIAYFGFMKDAHVYMDVPSPTMYNQANSKLITSALPLFHKIGFLNQVDLDRLRAICPALHKKPIL